jgi:hypothetical protein
VADPYKGKLTGHSLQRGRYVGFVGHQVWVHPCTCGAICPNEKTMAQAKRWHRQHKGDIIYTERILEQRAIA